MLKYVTTVFPSQQKLDIFHFLLWLPGEGRCARSRAIAMQTMSFLVRSNNRMKQMLCATYGRMSSTLLQRRELLELMWKQCMRLLNAIRVSCSVLFFHSFQVFKMPLTVLCYTSSGCFRIYEVNQVKGILEVQGKKPATLVITSLSQLQIQLDSVQANKVALTSPGV